MKLRGSSPGRPAVLARPWKDKAQKGCLSGPRDDSAADGLPTDGTAWASQALLCCHSIAARWLLLGLFHGEERAALRSRACPGPAAGCSGSPALWLCTRILSGCSGARRAVTHMLLTNASAGGHPVDISLQPLLQGPGARWVQPGPQRSTFCRSNPGGRCGGTARRPGLQELATPCLHPARSAPAYVSTQMTPGQCREGGDAPLPCMSSRSDHRGLSPLLCCGCGQQRKLLGSLVRARPTGRGKATP